MEHGFRPHDRDRTTESMVETKRGFGLFGWGFCCNTQKDFAVARLTVGAPNDHQME